MKKILLLICFLHCFISIIAQDTLELNLGDAIQRSMHQSVDAITAKNEYKASYWTYRTYKAELYPEVVLNTTIPYYSKSYNQHQNSDGSYTFVSNNYSRINAGFSISQNLPLTGGILSIESSMQRLEQYGQNSSLNYMTLPASITLEQPLFGFNRIRWMQKTEPLRYKEAELRLAVDLEEIANTAIQHYFNLLLGQINLEIAEQNLKNAEKLYTIAEARRKIGQISETDLLQLKVSLLKAEAYMTNAQASLNARMFQLRSYLGYSNDITLKTSIPDLFAKEMPNLIYEDVLTYAQANNPFTQNIQRRMLEATRDVNKAKADRWNAKLFLSFGISGRDDKFSQAFNATNWRDNQVVNMGIKVPVLDWGKGKGRVKIAEAKCKVVNSRIEKEAMDFNQNIFLAVQNYNNQSKQLQLAQMTDEIAQKRYEISIETFLLGKIDILNLNDAQLSKDEAKRNYIEQMYLLWSYYYQIRSLTLYDFINKKEITVSYDEFK